MKSYTKYKCSCFIKPNNNLKHSLHVKENVIKVQESWSFYWHSKCTLDCDEWKHSSDNDHTWTLPPPGT